MYISSRTLSTTIPLTDIYPRLFQVALSAAPLSISSRTPSTTIPLTNISPCLFQVAPPAAPLPISNLTFSANTRPLTRVYFKSQPRHHNAPHPRTLVSISSRTPITITTPHIHIYPCLFQARSHPETLPYLFQMILLNSTTLSIQADTYI